MKAWASFYQSAPGRTSRPGKHPGQLCEHPNKPHSLQTKLLSANFSSVPFKRHEDLSLTLIGCLFITGCKLLVIGFSRGQHS